MRQESAKGCHSLVSHRQPFPPSPSLLLLAAPAVIVEPLHPAQALVTSHCTCPLSLVLSRHWGHSENRTSAPTGPQTRRQEVNMPPLSCVSLSVTAAEPVPHENRPLKRRDMKNVQMGCREVSRAQRRHQGIWTSSAQSPRSGVITQHLSPTLCLSRYKDRHSIQVWPHPSHLGRDQNTLQVEEIKHLNSRHQLNECSTWGGSWLLPGDGRTSASGTDANEPAQVTQSEIRLERVSSLASKTDPSRVRKSTKKEQKAQCRL